MGDPNGGWLETPESWSDSRVVADVIKARAQALIGFVDDYLAIDPLDTAEVERERLAKAAHLVSEAIALVAGEPEEGSV